MMMFETSKHVPKTEKHCCVSKNISQQNSDHILTASFELSSTYVGCKDTLIIERRKIATNMVALTFLL